jgi:KUP system potassium uptake protein
MNQADNPEGRGDRAAPDGEATDESSFLVADEPPPDARLLREHERARRPAALLGLFALGVVYGDIGTSPIYAFRESLHGRNPMPASTQNVLGILSLIFWSLALVISLKYLFYIMRAENDGEGGILALAALLDPWKKGRRIAAFLGLFGAALLYGDGMITPAISVLSAVEGLQVAAPSMDRWVAPIAVGILLLLFLFQRRGTTGVGAVFGPIMAVWFVVLGVLGVAGILREPDVLTAVNPLHGARFFIENGFRGFLVLGAVFLVVTGGEAMYADLGHFGARPIRLGWFCVVLPALLLNYFGQGALLLGESGGAEQPFYQMAPDWALYPLVGLTTLATIIASQAVISGVFSLTRQAIQLGQSPRFHVEQTSEEDIGRVYLPGVNWGMMIATIGLVLGFRSSSGLAAAYGVAVSTTFVITTLLAYQVSRERWGWGALAASVVTASFLVIDLAFFGANMFKISEGGWFPLVVAAVIWLLMSTWARGRVLIRRRMREETGPAERLLEQLGSGELPRVAGTAVFLTHESEDIPPILRHHLKHNRALHETVLLVTLRTSNVPRVPFRDRLEAEELGQGIYRVIAHYGFMQSPNVPVLVESCRRADMPVSEKEETTYYVGRQTPIAVSGLGMSRWRARLFTFLSRNSPRAEATFGISPHQVVELGIQLEV